MQPGRQALDTIEIRGIRVHGRHGAYPGEKDAPQPFDIAIVVHADLRAAAASDRLADTLDYAELHRRAVRIVAARSFDLVERLADEILRVLFEDARIVAAEVSIAKPGRLDGATASVTLRRRRSEP